MMEFIFRKSNLFLRIPFLLLLFVGCFFLSSCEYDFHRFFFRGPTPEQRAETLQDISLSPSVAGSKLNFVIITDLHFGSDKHRGESELLDSLKGRPIDFMVLLGDVVEVGFDKYFEECEQFISRLRSHLSLPDLKIYVVLGNHDLYQNGYDGWQKLSFNAANGSTFFRFKTTVEANGRGYQRSWYFLDTASGLLGQSQMNALKSAMNSDPNPKMVFTHYPVYADMHFFAFFKLSDDRERAQLITLFDRTKVDMVFSGHWHDGSRFDYGNFSELCCSSFIENSSNASSWYFLVLDEEKSLLSVEEYKVSGGDMGKTNFNYTLGRW